MIEKSVNREIYDKIEESSIEELYQEYLYNFQEFKKHGYQEYAVLYYQYFKKKKDYLRIIWNYLVKRILVKPLTEAFYRKQPPAFYSENASPPTHYEALEDLKMNVDKFASMMFADDRSKKILETMVRYRLTGDKTVLFYDICDNKDIYFDTDILPFFRSDWNRVFVDCGAYTGDSITSFWKYKRKDSIIYAFEADAENYRRLKRKWGKRNGVSLYNFGAGERKGYMKICGTAQGAHLGAESGKKVKVVKLDDVIDVPVTYIKMDIEGMELDALGGGKEHIIRDKPVLAVSVYHKLEDIHAVYEFIKNLKLDYKFILRHYGNTISEYVLYAF